MSIYTKLNEARFQLQNSGMEKRGKNQNFSYFELKDFLPKINEINRAVGLCVVCSFDKELATLTIFDTESDQTIVFTSPMAGAKLPNGQAIQNLGATETYERRYLYLTAYEIVEHDKIDAMTPAEHKKATKILPMNNTTLDYYLNELEICDTVEDIVALWESATEKLLPNKTLKDACTKRRELIESGEVLRYEDKHG